MAATSALQRLAGPHGACGRNARLRARRRGLRALGRRGSPAAGATEKLTALLGHLVNDWHVLAIGPAKRERERRGALRPRARRPLDAARAALRPDGQQLPTEMTWRAMLRAEPGFRALRRDRTATTARGDARARRPAPVLRVRRDGDGDRSRADPAGR